MASTSGNNTGTGATGTSMVDESGKGGALPKPEPPDATISWALESFDAFYTACETLDQTFQETANDVRNLRSSDGLLWALGRVRNTLRDLLQEYSDAQADNFSTMVFDVRDRPLFQKPFKDPMAIFRGPRRPVNYTSSILGCLRVLESDLRELGGAFSVTNGREAYELHYPIRGIHEWIEKCASYLGYDGGPVRSASYPRGLAYAQHTYELHFALHKLSASVESFRKEKIGRIQYVQEDQIKSLQNLSIVAALLSSVTATCLQLTYQQQSAGRSIALNLSWTISITFSVSCALWSQLASRWISASFHIQASIWMGRWVQMMPLVLLCASSITFTCGLVCLTFSLFPRTVIPVVVTSLTGILAVACLFVAAWSIAERIFFHPDADAILETTIYLCQNVIKLVTSWSRAVCPSRRSAIKSDAEKARVTSTSRMTTVWNTTSENGPPQESSDPAHPLPATLSAPLPRLSAANVGSLRALDVPSDRIPLAGHVLSAAFSADGAYFAIVECKQYFSDCTLRLWKTNPEFDLLRSRRLDTSFWKLAFSPDGEYLAGLNNFSFSTQSTPWTILSTSDLELSARSEDFVDKANFIRWSRDPGIVSFIGTRAPSQMGQIHLVEQSLSGDIRWSATIPSGKNDDEVKGHPSVNAVELLYEKTFAIVHLLFGQGRSISSAHASVIIANLADQTVHHRFGHLGVLDVGFTTCPSYSIYWEVKRKIEYDTEMHGIAELVELKFDGRTGRASPAHLLALRLDGRTHGIDIMGRGEAVACTVSDIHGRTPKLQVWDASTAEQLIDLPLPPGSGSSLWPANVFDDHADNSAICAILPNDRVTQSEILIFRSQPGVAE